MMGGHIRPCPVRLCNIPGFDGRTNDVVYCKPMRNAVKQALVVFFGGDVQDFTENMQSHRDNKNYIKWNLENTAQLLNSTFLDCHIMVVRPSRMELKTFSCYDNFVRSVKCGAPDHTPMHYSLLHLEELICNTSEQLRTMTDYDVNVAMELSRKALVAEDDLSVADASISPEDEVWRRDNINLEDYDIKLVAFSKGCVVLNQFLYEFHYFKTLKSEDTALLKIISKIKDMYWLDGGHSGGKNTWITSRPLLETLTGLGINIHVHVTPYQIKDDRRPWIKKEEKIFSDIIRKQGASIDRMVHFIDLTPSLVLHFDVLKVFGQSHDSSST